ncbi:hypothetical protein EXU32_07335 [Janibacter limosus]|jgi:hypothetical protein|uniref:DUF4177 domain-containing protein n=2 Tax=Janibacter limosus TaxID=53458 RepID=A0A4P6MRD6_9MICO|nr:DUF5703 family protein [Janibacter limosus]QBF46084.1 hypothetical protein EXU32_07335 [Janibacter limosus]
MALMPEYEFRTIQFPRGAGRAAIRQELTDHAEYGHWELHRTVVYLSGMQKAWLRRKIIRVPRPPAFPSR